ncbi:hypothetical protein WI81_17120 [Burkholderia ubonensis]|nr:hypothetical protein WI81_17120 [Burkholderia ubonensis]
MGQECLSLVVGKQRSAASVFEYPQRFFNRRASVDPASFDAIVDFLAETSVRETQLNVCTVCPDELIGRCVDQTTKERVVVFLSDGHVD